MKTTAVTYELLAGLRAMLPDLDEELLPGTPRRWAEHDLTSVQRMRQDALVIAEKAAKAANLMKGIKPLGESKAPLRLDVLEAMADITAGVAELESAVADRLGITPLVGASTAERISRLIGLLDRIVLHDDLDDHVHSEASRLHRAASRALGDSEIVRQLTARCHICDKKSLRAFMDRELIVCISESCRCDDEQCGCHGDPPRRHRWPFSQWSWLADVLAEDIGLAG